MVFASSLSSPSISGDSRNPSPIRPPFSPFNLKPDSELRSPVDKTMHPVFHAGRVAVVTGAASGIGRAACLELASQRLRVVLADVNEKLLEDAGKEVAAIVGEGNILTVPTDVSKLEDVQRLKDRVLDKWGEVCVVFFAFDRDIWPFVIFLSVFSLWFLPLNMCVEHVAISISNLVLTPLVHRSYGSMMFLFEHCQETAYMHARLFAT